MAKGRDPKSVLNRQAYSRISYLYQAAALFATRAGDGSQAQPQTRHASEPTALPQSQPHTTQTLQPLPSTLSANQAISRRLLVDLRSVSLKTQIRLNPRLKRTICKFCDTLQVEGSTCVSTVENSSKGGRKPWADVLVCKCLTCGRAKRYPVGATRQQRRDKRGERTGESLVEGGDVAKEEDKQ